MLEINKIHQGDCLELLKHFSPPNHKWLGYPKNTIYMKTEITDKKVKEINEIKKLFPNGCIETSAGKVYWVWRCQIRKEVKNEKTRTGSR